MTKPRYHADGRLCSVCHERIRFDRHDEYCSKPCQASIRGWSDSIALKKAEQLVALEGSTAWRPSPMDPIFEINSHKPVMIFSDIHAPIHCVKWLAQGLKMADRMESDILIVNGDFIDANQISRHIGGYYRRRSELNDDFQAGEALLDIFAKRFKEVYFLNGNHCGERLVKVFRGEVAMQRLWKMFGSHDNVKVSARSYVVVNRDVIVGHPRQYSRIRGSTSQNIAQANQKHIVLGHGHHSASSISRDGRWQARDVGCMADLTQQDYVRYEISDFPEPLNGFGAVIGTNIQLFDKFTPWEFWGVSAP